MGTHQKRGSRTTFDGVLVLLISLAVVALAACGGAGTTATGPTMTPSAVTTASPQSTAAVSEFHGMLPVVFTQSLIKERHNGSTKTVGGVVQMRRTVWTYRNESSDPRLSGRLVVVLNVDQRQADMSARLWGTSRLSNQGGT